MIVLLNVNSLGCANPVKQATICIEIADSCLISAKWLFLEYESTFLYNINNCDLDTL